MKKIILMAGIFMMIVLSNAYALSFDFHIGHYHVQYSEPQEIVHAEALPQVQAPQEMMPGPVYTHQFDDLIKNVNSYKKTQLVLKEIDEKYIGIEDTDTGSEYTAVINRDGTINSVILGSYGPGFVVKGSFSKVREDLETQNYEDLKERVIIPWNIRAKLFLFNLWN